MKAKLTKRVLDDLKSPDKRVVVFDSETRGFAVRAMPSGLRTFYVQYRTRGGRSQSKSRRVTIGRFGDLTFDEARTLARKILGEVAHGKDPAGERSQRISVPTVSQLGEEYLRDVDDKKKKSTAIEYRRLWRKEIDPRLGSLEVGSVTTAHVSGLQRSIREAKPKHVASAGRKYIANRALALLGAFFQYAEKQGIAARGYNPVRGVTRYKEESRERFLSADEIRRLGEALTKAATVGVPPAPTRRKRPAVGKTAKHRPLHADEPKPANPFAIAAIRFLMLTGFREMEALSLRWDEVDFERRMARLSDTKTGKSTRHLGASAVLLLRSLPRVEGSLYVFPGSKSGQHLKEINRVWYAVRREAGLDGSNGSVPVRLHDLRHTFASHIASSGGSLLVIRQLLGHKDTTTTEKYAHLLNDPVQATADATSEALAAFLGRINQPSISVVR